MAEVQCIRCGKAGIALDQPPAGGALGERIRSSICANCWQEWISHQVLLINHYGLQMADPDDRRKLTAAMKEFLHLDAP